VIAGQQLRPQRAPVCYDASMAPLPGGLVLIVELTEEHIAVAMRKAEARVCVGSDRCFALPHLLVDARPTCTPTGRCKVGWIVSRGGIQYQLLQLRSIQGDRHAV
jgi:hypothetical protein